MQDKCILLIDNIDGVLPSLKNWMTSKLIDVFHSSPSLIIGTCAATVNVHSKLLVKYRFGRKLQLRYPSKAGRYQFIADFLSSVTIINDDHSILSEAEKSQLMERLGASSQGHSIPAIYAALSTALALHQMRHDNHERVLLTNDLSLALESLPSAVLNDSVFVSGLVTQIKEQPAIINLEGHLSSILKSMRMGGGRSTSGVLVCGPPGCGKSSLARRIAFECSSTHKFIEVSCAELVHKVVGESERKLVEIFRIGNAYDHLPCWWFTSLAT